MGLAYVYLAEVPTYGDFVINFRKWKPYEVGTRTSYSYCKFFEGD